MATSGQHGNVNRSLRVGVYPGSFNPPTVAHIQIALAALSAHRLDRVDFAISVTALGKDAVSVPSLTHRLQVMKASVESIEGLGVIVTEHQLIADIAESYDVVVMGADKWAQVNDPVWYRTADDMHEALARLPTLALAPRSPHVVPSEHALDVAPDLLEISSSAVRAGRTEWMTPAAAAFDKATGAWTAPDLYERDYCS